MPTPTVSPAVVPAGRQLLKLGDLTPRELDRLTRPDIATSSASTRLRGTLAMLFEQPSLRTASSFAAAAVRVGWAPVAINARGHEVRAGCDLADELHQLSLTSDCVVVRSNEELTSEGLAACRRLLINAGDGDNEHPTQALIDLTVLRQLGLQDKSVVMMGNLRDHRTHHSLLAGLKAFGARVTLVAPPGLAMTPRHAGTLPTLQTENAEEVDALLSEADAVYMTPVQYWDTPHAALAEAFRLDLDRAQRVLKVSAKVLHPFPRLAELHASLDPTAFNAYHQQVEAAVAVRARLLEELTRD